MAKDKETVKAAPVAPPKPVGYETTDGNEALRYIQAGGHHIGTTKLFPKNPFKAGKRFVFLESKARLDELVAQSETGEGA